MKNDPLVSIIITNFNKSKFIIQSLQSCSIQKYKKIEVIFFDDKSTDNSLQKVIDFKKKNNLKINILSNKNKKNYSAPTNQVIAINESLKYVKGEYVFFLDSDDFFHRDKIFKIMNIYKQDSGKKMVSDLPIYKYRSKKIKKYFTNLSVKNKWPKFPPTSCMSFETKILKKIIKKINFKNYPNLAIDFFLAVYYHIILKKFYIHNLHLTYYRQVNDGTDSIYRKFISKKWWKRREEAFEFLNDLMIKNNLQINKSFDFILTTFVNFIIKI